MKRCLLILLIALLPVQFSWAAVGAYCSDEHETAGEHALHATKASHSKTTANADSGSDLSSDQGFDNDCGKHCHGHVTSMPPAVPSNWVAPAPASWSGQHAVLPLRLVELRPERPQWRTLA